MTYPSTMIMVYSVLFFFILVTGLKLLFELLITKKSFGPVQTKSAKVLSLSVKSVLGIKIYYVELKIPNTKIRVCSKSMFKNVEVRSQVLIETQAVYFEPRFKSITVRPSYYRVISLITDSKIILKSAKKNN